ncbi:F-box family protein [Quillaja saponaria]|uniref:F-box family protein n=1 Tax=Quillaja saponaria TaxID=32244 RepID=A0AAD7L695_QUISA|nr:F-box family protein [Quillaja saponaria]KAJ7951617.1 F-box family protein [Quillaja saponaria]
MSEVANSTYTIEFSEDGKGKSTADFEEYDPVVKKSKPTIPGAQNVEIFEEEVKEDRLSDLPECLIHHILSFMDTRPAVRTCVLSKRWRYFWISVPDLNFCSKSFRRLISFKRFVDGVLSHHGSSRVGNLTFYRFGVEWATDRSQFQKVIEYAASRGVENIDVDFSAKSRKSSEVPYIQIPFSLFKCQSLKALKLKSCYVCTKYNFQFETLTSLHLVRFKLSSADADCLDPFASLAKFFGFKTLTILHLKSLTLSYKGTDCLDPFASCINLKNLHLSRIICKSDKNPIVIVISPPQLSNLTLEYSFLNCKLMVSAPQLTSFSYLDSPNHCFFEFKVPCLRDLIIDVDYGWLNGLAKSFQKRKREEALYDLVKLFQGLHNAENVTLTSRVVSVLVETAVWKKYECSPFCELKCLKLGLGMELTCKSNIENLDNVAAFFRNGSRSAEVKILNT